MISWILEAIENGPSNRNDLFDCVQKMAGESGYSAGDVLTLAKGLNIARRKGLVNNIQKGWWEITEQGLEELSARRDTYKPKKMNGLEDTVLTLGRRSINCLRTIGDGDEVVYVVYSKPHAEIAKRDQKTIWRCKIGKTKGLSLRLLRGGARTFVAEEPVVGLAIRCRNASSLESVIHNSLRIAGMWIQDDVAGSELFFTSPQHVELFYMEWLKSLRRLQQ